MRVRLARKNSPRSARTARQRRSARPSLPRSAVSALQAERPPGVTLPPPGAHAPRWPCRINTCGSRGGSQPASRRGLPKDPAQHLPPGRRRAPRGCRGHSGQAGVLAPRRSAPAGCAVARAAGASGPGPMIVEEYERAQGTRSPTAGSLERGGRKDPLPANGLGVGPWGLPHRAVRKNGPDCCSERPIPPFLCLFCRPRRPGEPFFATGATIRPDEPV